MKFIKPLLKYITTIDFGRTLTFQDFNEIKNKINKIQKKYIVIINIFNKKNYIIRYIILFLFICIKTLFKQSRYNTIFNHF